MIRYDELALAQPTHDRARQTCGPYYYLVQYGALSFTAFRTRYGLLRWLKLRGLKLTENLVPEGESAYQRLDGHFYEEMLNVDDYRIREAGVEGEHFYQMSNGNYVPAIAYVDKDGDHIVAYPHAGIDSMQPKVENWYGLGSEEGVVRKNFSIGEDWIFGSDRAILKHCASIDTETLSEAEKGVFKRAMVNLKPETVSSGELAL